MYPQYVNFIEVFQNSHCPSRHITAHLLKTHTIHLLNIAMQNVSPLKYSTPI